LVKVLWWWN